MIIETSANQFYRVTEFVNLPGLDHCWSGIRVTRRKGGWVVIAKTLPSGSVRKDTVRKVGCRIIDTEIEMIDWSERRPSEDARTIAIRQSTYCCCKSPDCRKQKTIGAMTCKEQA